ncbi:SMI1 / KNR4 family (SUKH-1) [Paenibacillus tianmuensis]|uniref:SMI1 / KNR4 family (SUKH-1) n=1 Tax=Paenibacillus tianmuensis TaxID=624147 RepID=A0A1G4PFQ4_9BACL|nr:SMI1/KNR4 family protein [Paenibacillus tianmuensis]SCW31142.1 SMI1 / KNR4 family (SUKH-1) [Paenibacillus tianmuensis]
MDFNEYMAFVRKCSQEPIQELTELDFNDLEKTLETKLPAEFKSYYLEYNGNDSAPDECCYLFFPIKYGFSIERRLEVYAKQGIHFGKKIPFAGDEYGHTYVLSLEDSSFGKVLFLQHEYEDNQEYEVVANSFSEFLTSFVSKGKTFLR